MITAVGRPGVSATRPYHGPAATLIPPVSTSMGREPMKASPRARDEVVPEARKLTERQAARLSELSGVASEELAGRTIAELRDKLGSILEPHWFLFRKVCGRVV